MNMTVNKLYTYFKAIHLCNTTGCAECKEIITGNKEGTCPLDTINKDEIREYLYNLADKLLNYTDKDYPVDEESLLSLLMTDVDC